MTDPQGTDPRHVDDDVAAYALDTLDPEERAIIDTHLGSCERCRVILADYRRVAASVRAAGAVPPSPGYLWDRIEAELRRPGRIAQPPSRGASRFALWAAAAAAALVLAATGGWYLGSRASDEDLAPADLVGVPTDDLVFTLLNLEPGSPAQGRVFMSSDRTRGMVVITGLHRLDSERQWGVWIVRDDRTRLLLDTFGVDADGSAIVPLRLTGLPSDYETVYVGLAVSPVSRITPGQQAGPDAMAGPLY